MRYAIQNLTANQLKDMVTAKGMRVVPDCLYDTQLYPLAGITTPIKFFGTGSSGGEFLTNLGIGGQLSQDEFFVIYNVVLDVLGLAPGATSLTDMYNILLGGDATGGPIIKLRYLGNDWGPVPLSMCGGSGGPIGGEDGAAGANQWATNGMPGASGWWIGGQITLKALTSFYAQIQYSKLVPITANAYLRVGLQGAHYYPLS